MLPLKNFARKGLRWIEWVQQLWSYSICKNLRGWQECLDRLNVPMTMLLHIYGPNQFHGMNLSVLQRLNSLAPGGPKCDSKNLIFNLVLLTGIFRSSYENALRWLPQDLTDDKSILVQVMAWCRQATSHYLSQCWLSSLSPYGIARPQWVHPLIYEWCHLATQIWRWNILDLGCQYHVCWCLGS